MKILFASTPGAGHLNPLLGISRILLAEGHEAGFLTGTALRAHIDKSGGEFFPLPPSADFDPQDVFTLIPELKCMPPGLDWLRLAFERIFVDSIPAQHQALGLAADKFAADVIVGDDMFFGVLPMLLGPREAASYRSVRDIDPALDTRGRGAEFCRPAARDDRGAAREPRGHRTGI